MWKMTFEFPYVRSFYKVEEEGKHKATTRGRMMRDWGHMMRACHALGVVEV